jgi:hypothetical protein
MALRSVANTDTLETFRTTFNSHATDTGDLASLTTSAKSSLVAAINEAASASAGFTLRDSSSTTQAIAAGNTLNVVGAANEVTAVVSATDTLTIGLNSNISGLTSVSATTGTFTNLTVGGASVATNAFAIAQAVALG